MQLKLLGGKDMEKIISFCGTVCTECPAFIATKNDDDDIRKETAKLWSKQYNADIKNEDINCEGCTSERGIKFNYCNVCEIRKCGKEKGVSNCAYCSEYICDKLSEFFKIAPENKTTLDEIRKEL